MKISSSSALAASLLMSTALASPATAAKLSTRQTASADYANPADGGGRMLTYIPNFPTNVGEPINVIISGASDSFIRTPRGFLEWASSIQLIPNACIIRENLGGAQQADLGDGNGRKNQSDVLRYSYWTDNTCAETVNGGNHARYWRQNGSSADTGAWFLAASVEMPLAQSHDIVSDGYDLGRDWIVGNATQDNGTLSTGGYVFQASSTSAPLLQGLSTSDINHNIAIDGNVAVLTVRLVKNGTSTSGGGSSSIRGGSSAAIMPSSGNSGKGASAAPGSLTGPSLSAMIMATSAVIGAALVGGLAIL
ncbi:hypothetical protein OC842_002955 [Tilletia horrida]|uniref:Uncharacterized protein n=1 Tax=Tilletia horrida TaxID=155126 RepID=A0AAN6GC72_9BASI|nr:hypothetical protein OC842_002955 [Tilletia horrida]